jgi:Xaa-Pro aminopeptidase
MRYLPISKELFTRNRQNFTRHLKPGAIAVFNSNDVMPTNADGTMPFRQNNDLYYLSGIDQEETILILFPDAKEASNREILFIKETNEQIAIWEGEKLSKEEAAKLSGIQNVLWTSQFQGIFENLITQASYIYLNSNEHTRATKEVETRDDRFVKWCTNKFQLYQYERAAPIMQKLRTVKAEEEIAQIKKACEITGKAFQKVLRFIKPGLLEYEIEAEITHEFIRNGSRGHAYQPIIASGANSCVLHYIDNSRVCKDGDIILMDFGAEYANYASDLTRVVPVSGKFTPRQKEVYNAVRNVMNQAFKLLVPGNTMENYNESVRAIMEEELLKIRLLSKEQINNQNKENPAYRKFFMHGISHALGLDVHDVFEKRPFEPGMVFTLEPGIYIREEGLGIRLENEILITEKGPVNLMEHIPIEAEEIEALMAAN